MYVGDAHVMHVWVKQQDTVEVICSCFLAHVCAELRGQERSTLVLTGSGIDIDGPPGCSPACSAGRALLPFGQLVNRSVINGVRAEHGLASADTVTLCQQQVPLWRLYNSFSTRGGYAAIKETVRVALYRTCPMTLVAPPW